MLAIWLHYDLAMYYCGFEILGPGTLHEFLHYTENTFMYMIRFYQISKNVHSPYIFKKLVIFNSFKRNIMVVFNEMSNSKKLSVCKKRKLLSLLKFIVLIFGVGIFGDV